MNSNYDNLTDPEKTFVTGFFRQAFLQARPALGYTLVADETTEAAIEAFAKLIVESRRARFANFYSHGFTGMFAETVRQLENIRRAA